MPEYSSHDNGVLEAEPVQLQPFIHQVGGHSCVLKFNETTLCKPLITREHLFYESMPSDLKEFTPDYRGVIEVELQEDLNGEITLMGYPLQGGKPGMRAAGERLQRSSPKPYEREMSPTSSGSETDNPSSPVMASRSKHACRPDNSFSVRLLRSGSIEMRTQTDTVFKSTDAKSEQKSAGFNPWSLKCHKRQLAKMRNDNQDNNQKRFILLENVAARFKFPCILDLKMGTRQHGDDAPEAKKNSQMRKCANTTSKAVGLRLIGMQVYQTTSGQFMCQNKYYGRKLSVPGFKESLELFLYDGDKMRLELLDPILQRLRSLYAMVDKQDTFRFYSSSLLIMYDGIQKTVSMETRDHSCESSHMHRNGTGNSEERLRDIQGTSCDRDMDKIGESTHGPVGNLNNLVDVRMIDFAHSTHSGFPADAAHKGVDQGYLFGIQNLIAIFEEIQQRYSGSHQTDNG